MVKDEMEIERQGGSETKKERKRLRGKRDKKTEQELETVRE